MKYATILFPAMVAAVLQGKTGKARGGRGGTATASSIAAAGASAPAASNVAAAGSSTNAGGGECYPFPLKLVDQT